MILFQNKRIENLQAEFEHLQYRFDGLRDYVKEHPDYNDANYYWNRFEDLLAWSWKYDKNSEEYHKLATTAWHFLDKYLEALKINFIKEVDK